MHEDIEFYSVMRSLKAIEETDVCIIMLDATLGLHSQDLSLFSLAKKNNKGIVILVNKWDLVEKETNTVKMAEDIIRKSIQPFTDVPIIFISAITKQRIYKALEEALEVYNNMQKKIPTSKLNEFILPEIAKTPPPAKKGKYINIKFATQLPTKSLSFAFFTNLPQYVPERYARFIENKLRDEFNFSGVPINIFFIQK